jgi:DNA modification methylase
VTTRSKGQKDRPRAKSPTLDAPHGEALGGLSYDPRNARRRTEQSHAMIVDSIKKYGFGRSLLAGAQGTLIAGNGAMLAAIEAGKTKVRVIPTDGEEIVVLQRTDLTPDEEQLLAYADNRSSDLSTWDAEQVLADMQAGVPLEGFFSQADLQKIMTEHARKAPQEGPGDDVTHIKVTPRTAIGQCWQIGKHRLAVGDCTDPRLVAALFDGKQVDSVVTDPPFGQNYGDAQSRLHCGGYKTAKAIQNDGTDVDLPALIRGAFAIIPFAEYSTFYAFTQGISVHLTRAGLDEAGMHTSCLLVWLKNNPGMTFCEYRNQTEFILFGWKDKHQFYGEQASNVLEYNRNTENTEHPTQKPIPLIMRLVADGSAPGARVYDPFCGSGTTGIACERLGRVAYLAELDPQHADTTLARLEAETGEVAQCVGMWNN